jgi:hypothetical protein
MKPWSVLGEVVGGGWVHEVGAQPPHVRLSLLDESGQRPTVASTGGAGNGCQLVHEK